MSVSGLTDGPDGLPARLVRWWSKDKLAVVARYMDIFTTGMKDRWRGLAYVDLFSGPGLCIVDEPREVIPGSPLLALRTRWPFDRVICVEADPEAHDALRRRLTAEPRGASAVAIPGDCNDVIDRVIAEIPEGHLSLAFLDPTGVSFTLETVRRLVAGRAVDLVVLFPQGMSVNRNRWQWIGAADDTPLDLMLERRDWRTQIIPEVVLFIERVRELGFAFVEGSGVTFENNRRARLYYLVFATRSERGLDFWRKITAVGPGGQMRLPSL
jgi:three-Cys-motif partner protein